LVALYVTSGPFCQAGAPIDGPSPAKWQNVTSECRPPTPLTRYQLGRHQLHVNCQSFSINKRFSQPRRQKV